MDNLLEWLLLTLLIKGSLCMNMHAACLYEWMHICATQWLLCSVFPCVYSCLTHHLQVHTTLHACVPVHAKEQALLPERVSKGRGPDCIHAQQLLSNVQNLTQ